VFAELVDNQVAPAWMDPPDSKWGYPEEVIGEAIDQLAWRSAEASGVVASDGRGKLAFVDQPRRRVEQGDQQLAVLSLERLE
jgi:hypothetical protein